MLFTTIVFALFFLIVVFFYYLLPSKFQWVLVLFSSVFFYVYSNPIYIVIPSIIILVTYNAGVQIEKIGSSTKSNIFYFAAIFVNLGILVFFKYTNFFTSIAFDLVNIIRQRFFNASHAWNNNLLINVIVPLGISYITFQAIGYLIEIKRGNQAAEKNIGHFSAYLFFFPKIIAGPVERANHFLPQLKEVKTFYYDNISIGLKLILWGLFKKLVIADRLSIYVSAVYNNENNHSGITLFITLIFYVFQIYADFSGYTDMARGMAKILGFNIMENFKRPLLARSVTEFWRRWHISLSSWFADYVYKPLAIEKRDWGNWGILYAFVITFAILGFWHGANLTYIVFGFLQGFILSVEFFTRKTRKKIRQKIPDLLNTYAGIAFTFGYFAFSLIFFRAQSVSDALTILKRLFTARGTLFIENPSILIFSILGILFLLSVELKKEFYDNLFTLSNNKNWLIRNSYYCFLVLVILIAGVFDGGEFIYFQF